MAILETRNLYFSYEKGKEILKNINIRIARGSFVALLGANGCGKTTLLENLNGILKPYEGETLYHGTCLRDLKDKEIFSRIGLVFQNPDDQLIALTVYEDVSYGVKNLGINGDEVGRRVENALELLEINDLKEMEIHKLSYGQKKRVAIAGVLAMKPEILLLDEPTAGLDPMTASKLLKILKKIQKEDGLTLVISTHEVDMVPVNCDYVYVLNQGKVVLDGTIEEVFGHRETIRKSNLRLPRIGHLMEILREKDGMHVEGKVMTISGARKEIKGLLRYLEE